MLTSLFVLLNLKRSKSKHEGNLLPLSVEGSE